jgi:hypothetical protein
MPGRCRDDSPLKAGYPSNSLRIDEHDYEDEYEGILGAAGSGGRREALAG